MFQLIATPQIHDSPNVSLIKKDLSEVTEISTMNSSSRFANSIGKIAIGSIDCLTFRLLESQVWSTITKA